MKSNVFVSKKKFSYSFFLFELTELSDRLCYIYNLLFIEYYVLFVSSPVSAISLSFNNISGPMPRRTLALKSNGHSTPF